MPSLLRPAVSPDFVLNDSASARRSDERAKQLVRNVLEMVSLDVAVEAFVEAARADGQARAMLAAATVRGELAKPLLEARSGPSESTDDAGRRLGKSSETIRSWIERKKLVAYRPAADRTRIRLPLWQFDGRRVRPWVQPLIEAFGDNGWGLVDFLTVPRQAFGGAPYLHRLLTQRDADVREVLAAARRTNP